MSRDQQVTLPSCPYCESLGRIDESHDLRPMYRWDCGAWALVKNFEEHGAGAVVEYDSTCDLVSALRSMVRYADRYRLDDQTVSYEEWRMDLEHACALIGEPVP